MQSIAGVPLERSAHGEDEVLPADLGLHPRRPSAEEEDRCLPCLAVQRRGELEQDDQLNFHGTGLGLPMMRVLLGGYRCGSIAFEMRADDEQSVLRVTTVLTLHRDWVEG